MDEQLEQRAEAFQQAYQALIRQYGVELVPQVQARKLGPVIQIEAAGLTWQPVEGWTGPDPMPDPLTELQKEIEALREQLATAEAKGRVSDPPNGKPILTDEEAQRALHPTNGRSE